jgi:hypothetical protein
LDNAHADAMFSEATWYAVMRNKALRWIEIDTFNTSSTMQQTMIALYGPGLDAGGSGPLLPKDAKPEAPWRVAEVGKAAAGSALEIKSVPGGKLLLEQVALHGLADISRSYFQNVAVCGVTVNGSDVFYMVPPSAYSFCAVGAVVWVTLVELAGYSFITPISSPMFIGGEQLDAALAALPQHPSGQAPAKIAVNASTATWVWLDKRDPAGEPAVVEPTAAGEERASTPPEAVVWTTTPYTDDEGQQWFMKLIPWRCRTPGLFRSMVAVYAQLQAARSSCLYPPPPSLDIDNLQLLFGYFRVLVRAPFLLEFTAASVGDAEPLEGVSEAAVDAIAQALVWLLWHDILYVDLRGPNVMVPTSGGSDTRAAVLIDFDDARHVPGLREQMLAAGDAEAACAVVRGRLSDVHAAKDFTTASGPVFTQLSSRVKHWLTVRLEPAAPASASSAAGGAAMGIGSSA